MSRCDTNFNDQASRYDAWYRTPVGALAHALERETIFSLVEVKPGERVLDVGCGTGIYILELIRKGVTAIGVDPSIEMLRIGREKVRRAGLSGHFVCGSAEALPFRSEKFDLALAVTSLCFIHAPDRAVEEMRRVLRPGGRVILGELNRYSLWAFWRRLKGLFRETIYNKAHFWSRRELERLLGQKEFQVRAVQVVLHLPPVPVSIALKGYRFFEAVFKRILPGTGAFIAIRAERRERHGR